MGSHPDESCLWWVCWHCQNDVEKGEAAAVGGGGVVTVVLMRSYRSYWPALMVQSQRPLPP